MELSDWYECYSYSWVKWFVSFALQSLLLVTRVFLDLH